MINYRFVPGNFIFQDISDRFGGKKLDEYLDENKLNQIVIKQGKLIKYLSFLYLVGVLGSIIYFLIK